MISNRSALGSKQFLDQTQRLFPECGGVQAPALARQFSKRVYWTPINPQIKEFLRYILSLQGQSAVADQGEYLPLTREELDRQIAALD